MSVFTITDDNNITVFGSADEAATTGDATAVTFDSQAALATAAAEWPMARLVEVYNTIPGNAEVTKFADRKKAVARIWKAIQPLAANGQISTPEAVAAEPKRVRKPAKAGEKRAKKERGDKKAAGKPAGERSNKKAEVIAMMKRAKGATLAEIAEATGWQKHTIRGFVSILGSKGGVAVESSKNAAGERVYKIAK